MHQCGEILTKLLLYDDRYSLLERKVVQRKSSNPSSTASLNDLVEQDLIAAEQPLPKAKFMWGIWRCENEITLLLEEGDVDSFPEGSLIVSPQPWRVIKLAGTSK